SPRLRWRSWPVGMPSISRTEPLVCRCPHVAALVDRDGLSDASNVVILDRLQRNQTLIELALELAPRGKGGNPGQQHFVLCTHVTDLAFYVARFFAKEVLLVFDKDKEETACRDKRGEQQPLEQRSNMNGVRVFAAVFNRGHGSQMRSTTRSLALRARGLAWISSPEASIGRGVRGRKMRAGLCRGSGHSGRSIHSALRSRKNVFTIRSSSEWKLMTAKRAP